MRGVISSLLVMISVVGNYLFRIWSRIRLWKSPVFGSGSTSGYGSSSVIKKICTKFCLFNVVNNIVAQKVLITFVFIFYHEKFILCLRTLSFHFISDPYPNPGPDSELAPECITDPVPLRQKVPDPVLGPDPQHTTLVLT